MSKVTVSAAGFPVVFEQTVAGYTIPVKGYVGTMPVNPNTGNGYRDITAGWAGCAGGYVGSAAHAHNAILFGNKIVSEATAISGVALKGLLAKIGAKYNPCHMRRLCKAGVLVRCGGHQTPAFYVAPDFQKHQKAKIGPTGYLLSVNDTAKATKPAKAAKAAKATKPAK